MLDEGYESLFPDFDLEVRETMPGLTTDTTTATSNGDTSTQAASTDEVLGLGSSTGMPGITSSSASSGGMPGLTTSTTATSTSEDYTTPSVGVPSNTNNPYISRASEPLGTVFIAVGSIVAVVLIVFALFHLIRSLAASSVAKKTTNNEKFAYEKFAQNNNAAYGAHLTPLSSVFFNQAHDGSVAKLPLLSSRNSVFGGSHAGDASTIFNSEAASNTDLTNMFVSPTKEVMAGGRVKSHAFSGSQTNVSMYGKPLLVPASNRHSQVVPNLYINDLFNNSDYAMAQPQLQSRSPDNRPRAARKNVPSMYLDDLIDH